jgi:hypothetical protein
MKTYEPTDQDLIRWIGTWNTEAEVNGAGYHFGTRRPVTGEVVVIHSHGKLRRGIVVSVGRLNAKVALTTPSAVNDTSNGYELTRVAGKAMPFSLVAGHLEREMVDGTFGETEAAPSEPVNVETAPAHPFGSHQEPASPPATQTTGSAVVTVLERVWEAVRANHADLPPVVIVTGSGFVGPARWGHFRANGWTDREHEETQDGVTVNVRLGEMFVAGETLAKGAGHTVETMLHEAAHVLAQVRDVKDTSRQGRWHNQRFRTLAEEMGLEYPKESAHPQAGFSECLMTPGTREEYAPVIEELDKAIRMTIALPGFLAVTGEDGEGPGGGEFIHGAKKPRKEGAGPSTNNVKAVCGCETPRIIRASRKVLAEGEIVCGRCREPFEEEGAKFEPTDED